MKLTSLSLYQFKNYGESSFLFDQEVVCLVGRNGCGKTTLLDAIYFLCFTKSYLLHPDAASVMNGKQGMRLQGHFQSGEDLHRIECILRENGKKEMILNGVPYKRFAEHIGFIPCIFIAPDDVELIAEGGEIRRKFMDVLCSMLSANYLDHLSQYQKLLTQRNSLLKQWHELDSSAHALIPIYNEQLVGHAEVIHAVRKEITARLKDYCMQIYHVLSGSADQINLTYQSSLLEGKLIDQLQQNFQKDLLTQRSNYGIHKDDWVFELNGMPMKQAASQGQRKSFLFGLKLAQYHLIKEILHKDALILLDDIFEKLDKERSQKLIEYLMTLPSQKWITDTHIRRIKEALVSYENKTVVLDLG